MKESDKAEAESVEISAAVDGAVRSTGCADWFFVGVGLQGGSSMNFSIGNGRGDSEVSTFHRIQRALGLVEIAKHELIRKLIEDDGIFKGS